MIDKDLADSGKSLFQCRRYASLAVMAGGGLVILAFGQQLFDDPLRQFSYDSFWIALALVGALVRVAASGFAAPGTSGEAKAKAEAEVLNTTGIYSVVRNPLYVGRILTFTGLAFLTGVWLFGMIVFLLSILFYERVIAYEERFLSQKFGQAYSDWCDRVPPLKPKLSVWVEPDRTWWWRRLFLRETNKVLDVFFTVVAYSMVKGFAILGMWPQSSQLIVLALLLSVYFGKWLLIRYTGVFKGIS